MAPPSSSFARFVAALREVGTDASRRLADAIETLPSGQPELEAPGEFLLSWVDFEAVDDRATVGTVEGHRRAPVPDLDPASDERVLTVGYVKEFGVFVGWPGYDAGREWNRFRFPVPYRALGEAAETGWAEPLTSSRAYAFRPERAESFLRVHRREWEAPPEIVRAKAAGSPQRRKGRTGPPRVEDWFYGQGQGFKRFGLPELGEYAERPSEAPLSSPEVEVGLSAPTQPKQTLSRSEPLQPETPYLFWFSVGAERESIEDFPMPLPDLVEPGARIDVVLFTFEGEIEATGATRGAMDIQPDRRGIVVEPAFGHEVIPGALSERVLFFAIKTPAQTGEMRLRCNVYLGSTLLQSRLVTCQVGGDGELELDGRALASTVDYSFVGILDADTLERVPKHELSLLVNGGVGAASETHNFRFYGGGGELTDSASLTEGEIKTAIGELRGALRQASWGSKGEWKMGLPDLYGTSPGDEVRFREDLINLAIGGRRFYTNLAGELVKGKGGRKALARIARKPGRVQIASVNNGLYVPAGLFYDQRIETSAPPSLKKQMTICDAFLTAAAEGGPLEDSRCMSGECPNHGDSMIVCPSGFWGFRHEIGWPVGDSKGEGEIMDGGADAAITVGVSTDPRLAHRQAHVEKVLAIASGPVAESRGQFAQLAGQVTAPLVYFYCHGGSAGSEAFIELGPVRSLGLDRTFIQEEPIHWPDPLRPLVFINGCHTTALDPESLGGLVSGFVEDGNAIGVVGTEISLFEPLACKFGLLVVEGFLEKRQSIGEAVRHARLQLLRERNPLGLIYVPFVAADVRLVRRSRP